jgi:hypothetical protein
MWVSIVRSLSNRVSVKGHGFEYGKYTLNPAFVFYAASDASDGAHFVCGGFPDRACCR